jgi:phosphoglycerate dehydrogenase-like enzyme
VAAWADITVFTDHLSDPQALVARLKRFDILCVMRERTPLSRQVLEQLPKLRLIASTGPVNAAIDTEAANDLGIEVAHTGYSSKPTIEMTWAVLLGLARSLVDEVVAVKAGGWQQRLGVGLSGKTLSILGLGRIGSEVARIGAAFGMQVLAWSQNLTSEVAHANGAMLVSKSDLLQRADFLTIHTLLSRRTHGLVDAEMLALMKPTAYLINMSRGPIVDEGALLAALKEGRIAGAGVDVFDTEPLPADHPFRRMRNVLATPHLGYVTRDMYETFYRDSLRNIEAWHARNAG